MRRRREALGAALVLVPWVALGARDAAHVDRITAAHEGIAGALAIVSALAAYFQEPHLDGAHRCPTAGEGDTGEVGPTPPLAVACAAGRGERCRAREAPTAAAEYPSALWHEAPLWRDLDYEITEPHAFHYALRTRNEGGACDFVVSAVADLDGDGEHSRIEVHGRLDGSGVMLDPTWRIDQPTE